MKKFIMVATLAFTLVLTGTVLVKTASAAQFVYQGGLLKVGSHGTQVMDLQECLARLGNNPESNIDGSFGPITRGAVMAFQAENGVVVDGIIGPVTGPLYTNACAAGSTAYPAGCTSTEGYSTTTGESCSDGAVTGDLPAGCTAVDTPMYSPENGQRCVLGENGSSTGFEGTEGSVKSYSLGAADETEALEGQRDVEVYAADVELDNDGDLGLQRLDVWFSNSDSGSDLKPWKYFKSVSLLVDGDEVATLSADSSSDWSDYSNGNINAGGTSKEYRMRFNGIDKVFKSDKTTTISIAVTMQNTIDSANDSARWYINMDNDSGFRWVDGTGFVFSEGAAVADDLEDSFTVGGEETATIDLSVSTNNPDPAVILVGTSSDTNDKTAAIYNVEETQDIDVTIDTINVGVTVTDPSGGADLTGKGAGTIIKKAYLVVNGDVIGSETVPNSETFTNNTGDDVTETITFDNLNWDLSGDTNKDVKVVFDFDDTNDGARYDEGTTVQVDNFAITELEDANGNDEGDISDISTNPGAGNVDTLRTEGIDASNFTVSYDNTENTSGSIVSQIFTIGWDVEATGDDAYIPMTVSRAASTTDGIAFQIEDTSNTAKTVGEIATNTAFSSDADVSTNTDTNTSYFLVKKGSSNHFTLEVTATAGTATGYVRAQLLEMNFADTADTSDVNFDFEPLQDYQTLAKNIQA